MRLEMPASSDTGPEDRQISYTDLLIVGAGPAGLTLAAWASRFGLKARIIDDKATQVYDGRADGLHPRTIEILDSFGIATSITDKAQPIREICSWVTHLTRTSYFICTADIDAEPLRERRESYREVAKNP